MKITHTGTEILAKHTIIGCMSCQQRRYTCNIRFWLYVLPLSLTVSEQFKVIFWFPVTDMILIHSIFSTCHLNLMTTDDNSSVTLCVKA